MSVALKCIEKQTAPCATLTDRKELKKAALSSLSPLFGRQSPRAHRLGLHAQHGIVFVMPTDCIVRRSEGHSADSKVLVASGGMAALATIYQASPNCLTSMWWGCPRLPGNTLEFLRRIA